MYCNQCGKKLDDHSKYCSECGTKIICDPTVEEQQTDNTKNNIIHNDEESKQKEPSGRGCLIAFILIMFIPLIIGVVFAIIHETSEGQPPQGAVNRLISRDATNRDIDIDEELDISSLSIKMIILPNTDIDNLEITINYLDKNNNIIKTDVKQIGNVKSGVQVAKNITLTDFSLTEIFKISYCEIEVTGGTVSYFSK